MNSELTRLVCGEATAGTPFRLSPVAFHFTWLLGAGKDLPPSCVTEPDVPAGPLGAGTVVGWWLFGSVLCDWHYSKSFMCVNPFNPHSPISSCYSVLTDGETETQSDGDWPKVMASRWEHWYLYLGSLAQAHTRRGLPSIGHTPVCSAFFMLPSSSEEHGQENRRVSLNWPPTLVQTAEAIAL